MKLKDCRVTGCTNGECRKCKRATAARRERNQRDIRQLVAKHGLTDELTTKAEQIVCQAFAQLGMHDALERGGFDTSSSASCQTYIETGAYLRAGEANFGELVEWD